MIEITITNEEDLLIQMTPTDIHDKPTNVDGESITAFSSDPTILENGIVLDKEGPNYTIRCKGSGSTTRNTPVTITIECDADLGDGIETLSDKVLCTVSSLKAKALGLSANGIAHDAPDPTPDVVTEPNV